MVHAFCLQGSQWAGYGSVKFPILPCGHACCHGNSSRASPGSGSVSWAPCWVGVGRAEASAGFGWRQQGRDTRPFLMLGNV